MNELNLYGLLSPEEMNALTACMCVANFIGTECQVSEKPFDFQLLEEDGKIIFESVCVMFADETRVFIGVNDDGSLELEFQCYTDGDPREGEAFYKLNIGINIASKTEILSILNDWGAPLKQLLARRASGITCQRRGRFCVYTCTRLRARAYMI